MVYVLKSDWDRGWLKSATVRVGDKFFLVSMTCSTAGGDNPTTWLVVYDERGCKLPWWCILKWKITNAVMGDYRQKERKAKEKWVTEERQRRDKQLRDSVSKCREE